MSATPYYTAPTYNQANIELAQSTSFISSYTPSPGNNAWIELASFNNQPQGLYNPAGLMMFF